MATRRNYLIRTVTALCGDIAVAYALAAACAWLIQAAALGLFLSFMVWLIGLLLALALSQHIVHPSVQFLLSDQKLDAVIDTAGHWYEAVRSVDAQDAQRLWSTVRGSVAGLSGLSGLFRSFKPA